MGVLTGTLAQLVLLVGVVAVLRADALSQPEIVTAIAIGTAWCAAEGFSTVPGARRCLAPRDIGTGLAAATVFMGGLAERAVQGAAADPAGVFEVGLGLAIAGLGIRIAAIRALGPWFQTTTVAPGRLVRTGPYRWLAHPSEVGLTMILMGTAVVLGSAIAAAATASSIALSVHRCRIEDREIARTTQRIGLGRN